MKKLFIKGVLFITCLLIIDYLVGFAGQKMMHELNEGNHSGKVAMMCYNINYATPDIAIIGSSPALSAYVPKVIKDSLAANITDEIDIRNVSCYVQGMPYFLAELKTLINRKKPKLVILDMTPRYLSDFKDLTSVLVPYSIENKEIKKIVLNDADNITKILLHSNMYCLNTEVFSLLFGFTTPKGADGYCPNYGRLKIIPRDTVCSQPIVEENVKLFKEFISIVKDKDIHLVVATSPTCTYYEKDCEAYQTLIEICKKNDVPYYDFMNDRISSRDDIYADETHLNDEGAHDFTSYFYTLVKGELIKAFK